MNMNRRDFLGLASNSAVGMACAFPTDLLDRANDPGKQQMSDREFLRSMLYTREEVDQWLAGKAFPFAKYSSEFGWLLPDAYFRDGIDNSTSVYTYVQPDGERSMGNYADQPCRINTYGDSFTQCHQVSDNETWQDYLAQYYIGHYNPKGNLFCAFAMKDALVRMLDPKPAPYREDPTVMP